MATLNFIRGTVRGKLGQFVGSSWKGKSYIKTFTKPGNPKTADQVAVRTVFYRVSAVAKAIYEAVLKPYTFPKPRKMTAYNRMIQANRPMFEAKEWNPAALKIFDGPLANGGIDSVSLAVNDVDFTFITDGGDDDTAIAVVYAEDAGAAFFAEGKRIDGTIRVSIAALDTGMRDNLHAYLVFAREPVPGTAEKGQVSGTAYYKIN